jgi:hypothetical protein
VSKHYVVATNNDMGIFYVGYRIIHPNGGSGIRFYSSNIGITKHTVIFSDINEAQKLIDDPEVLSIFRGKELMIRELSEAGVIHLPNALNKHKVIPTMRVVS